MGTFTEEQVEAAIKRGIKKYHHVLGYTFGDIAPRLVEFINDEIVDVVLNAAKTTDEPDTKQTDEYSQTAGQQIRSDAYNLVLRSLNGNSVADETLHAMAEKIATNIENGFEKDASDTISVKIVPDTSAFQEVIDSIFGRIEWRREGWNDCKARMIRQINKQLKDPNSDAFMLKPVSKGTLKLIRDFLGTFHFDPDMP